MSAHAHLQPSSAYRWFICPGSVRLVGIVPDPDPGDAAAVGTACHRLFEDFVKLGRAPESRIGQHVLVVDQNVDSAEKVEVTRDMVEWVDYALEWLYEERRLHPKRMLRVEQRAHCGAYYGCPDEMWGTADIVLIDDEAAHLTVADEKYGFVEVDAEDNAQLQLYAIGICHDYGWAFKTIRTVIIQPRSSQPVKEHTYTVEELLDVARRIAPKVEAALDPMASLVPSEDGCKWCPAAGGCVALRERALSLVATDFASEETVSLEAIKQTLDSADEIRAWLNNVEAHAAKLLSLGQKIEGYKRVYGEKRRIWTNPERAGDALVKLGVKKDEVWTRELGFTPAQAEKKVGKAMADLLQPFIERPRGEPTLAKADDKREEAPPDFEPVLDLLE